MVIMPCIEAGPYTTFIFKEHMYATRKDPPHDSIDSILLAFVAVVDNIVLTPPAALLTVG